jgi:hypothetical protein
LVMQQKKIECLVILNILVGITTMMKLARSNTSSVQDIRD